MVVDFDQNPISDEDCWSGSYHSVQLDPDGHTLHAAFTYFDERGIWKHIHPVYKRKTSVNSRYNIYYLRLDLETGAAHNFAGDALTLPLNRREANAQCKLLDLERWRSADNGVSWQKQAELVPVPGLLYNNPILVEYADDSSIAEPNMVAFYGWEGPYSIQPVIDAKTDIPIVHRGRAFLLTEQ